MNKRVALTGGSGFIGQAITKRLQSLDCEILQIKREDYYTGLLQSKLESFNPNIIISAGAYGNHSTQTDDAETFEANVVKTFLLLNDTKNISYDAFINFGSSSEYGKKDLPMWEGNLLEPLSMYAATKAAGTMLCRGFAKKYNKLIVTVRPFSVYGPGEAEFRFIPTVIRSLIKDEELSLELRAFHDWIYIDDLVEGILQVIDKVKVLAGNPINIGTGKQYRNEEVVNLLSFIADKKPKIKLVKLRHQDSSVWVADNNLLKLCGWTPKVDLMPGLRKTYQYYKQIYENN